MCSQLFGRKVEPLARSGDSSPLSCSRGSSTLTTRAGPVFSGPRMALRRLSSELIAQVWCAQSHTHETCCARPGGRWGSAAQGALPLTRGELVGERGRFIISHQTERSPKVRYCFTWPIASSSWAGSEPGSAHARRMAGSRRWTKKAKGSGTGLEVEPGSLP